MSTFREPVFNLDELTNSDTVITWLNRTNQLVNAMNSFYLIDTFDGQGICSTRADGVVTLNIDAGPGLGFNAQNELVLDYSTATELTSATTTSPINSTDAILVQRSGVTYRVKADSVLPTTIKHKHTFNELISFPGGIAPSIINFGTNPVKAYITHYETDSVGHFPRGFNFVTNVRDSGINLNPESFIRNYFPEYIATSDGVPGWSPPYTNVPPSDLYFTTAVFNFATNSFRTHGEDEFSLGELLQDKISLRFYTGIEGDNGDGSGHVQNPVGAAYDSALTTLKWPMRWSLEFSESEFTVKCDEGYRVADGGTGSVVSQDAFKYTYAQSELNGLFSVTGKIYVSNLAGSSQFITTPNGANKVPLTLSTGLLNKKFTNRIVTSDYSSLTVGSLVKIGTVTDNDIIYEKAKANLDANSNVIGIVESISAGIATIVINGEFELSSVNNLEPGVKYYLSQTTNGGYVPEGTYSTGLVKPVFVATTTNSGVLLPAVDEANGITTITTFNTSDSSTETLDVDSKNYNLSLVGGQNIKLDVNSDNELVIRVDGLAGSQDTFKYISVDGVGGTDGDITVNATSPDDTLYLKSNTLRIYSDNTTQTITLEAPNAFTNFKFVGTSEHEYVPDSTNDTLQFIAGSGITFTHDTDDSIIISSTMTGAVGASDLNYGGGLRIFASDYDNTPTFVSLLGGDSNFFDAQHSSYSSINVNLNPNLQIVRDVSNPAITDKFTYNGNTYFLNADGNWPTVTHGVFVPDELAGYVFGRITPSHSGDNVTQPDNRIRRLSRKDLRFFLGIAGDGYIDNVNSVFNQWNIYNGPEAGTTVQASTKTGTLILEGGSGIEITDGGAVLGPNRIKITNTGVAQNAFAKVNISTYSGTIIDSYDASSSADQFTLQSGRFIKIDTNSNTDTAQFDLDISDDYVLLGNPGTTDGMNVIDLSGSSYCLVGRANGPIQSITANTLKWTGTTTATLTQPSLPLPYFGAVQVGTSPTPTILNAYGSNKGVLIIEPGTNVTFTADTTTNTLTINSTGGTTTPTSTGVGTLFVNTSQYNYASGPLTQLKLNNGNGITLTSSLDGTNAVSVSASFTSIPVNCVLGTSGTSSGNQTPSSISFDDETVLTKLTGSALAPLAITAAFGTASLKNSLGIKHYTSVSVRNSTTTTNATALANSTKISGANLLFIAGSNTTLNVSNSTTTESAITVNSLTNLYTDVDPVFSSTLPSATFVLNKVTNGVTSGKITATTRGVAQYFELYNSSTDANIRVITKETILPISTTTATVTTNLGLTNTLVSNQSLEEVIYHPSYSITIANKFTGPSTRGTYTVDAGDMTFTSSGTISFGGGGSLVSVGSRYLKAAATSNSVKFITDTGSVLNVSAFQTGAAITATTPNASMILHANSTIKFALAGALNGSTNWLQIAGTSTNQTITSSGTITINANTTFASGITVDFTGVTTSGLTPSSHASTHKSVSTEATNGTGTGSDQLQAWQIGGVTRAKPAMLNKIGIVTGDTFYDLDLTSVATSLLYNGATVFNATNYTTSVTTSNKGPLYLVVPNGTNPVTAGVSGPPGQIIFVKAT